MLGVVRGIVLGVIIAFSAGAAQAEMFGKSEEKYSDIRDFKKWKQVVAKNDVDMTVDLEFAKRWNAAIAGFAKLSTREEKIIAVNEWLNNSIKYEEDSRVWGKSDYWASPAETFAKGAGDCEDYAIAKYFTLKMLGFSEDELRIVVLKDTRKNLLHAVLAVDNGGTNYILDNQNPDVMSDIQISFYQPIYSINAHNWWRHS